MHVLPVSAPSRTPQVNLWPSHSCWLLFRPCLLLQYSPREKMSVSDRITAHTFAGGIGRKNGGGGDGGGGGISGNGGGGDGGGGDG
eukprot:977442-Pleurochrysis_carterae.AAC.1